MGNVSHSIAEAYTDKFSVLSCNEQHSIYHLRQKASGKLLIFKAICSTDDRTTENLVKIYEKRKSLNHENIVCLRDYCIKTKKVGSRHEVMETAGGALFECLDRTAYEQCQIKSREKKPFSNSQLWAVLKYSVFGMSYLQSKNIQHSSVSSRAIFLGKGDSVKISDPFVSDAESNYDAFLNGNATSYVSPNELASAKNGQKLPIHNSYKSDVFSLGLVMMELALLEGQEDLFNNNLCSLDQLTLLQRISSLYQNFGMWVSSILQRMLIINESSRPDWLQLQKQIIEYEKCTNSLGDFKTIYQQQRTVKSVNPSTEEVKSRLKLGQFRDKMIKLVSEQTPKGNTEHSSARNNQSLNIIHNSKNSARINSPEVEMNKVGHRRHFSHTQVPINKFLSPQGIPQKVHLMGRIPKIAISIKQISQYSQSKYIQERISMESYQTTKGIIVPMEVSQHDKPLEQQHPKQFYKIKTTIDDNLVDLTVRHSASSLFSNSVVEEQTNKRNSKFAFRNNYREVEMSPELTKTDNRYLPTNGSNKAAMNSPRMMYVKEVFKQGARYEGWKVRGMRQGQGKFYYRDGGMYDGEWHMNRMHGKGTLYYPSGQIAYEGLWVEDHFHGQGKVYNEKPMAIKKYAYSDFTDVEEYWVSYEGSFNQDLKQGYGILKLSSGQQYQGMFKKDQVHGQGIFRSRNTVRGLWSNNKIVKVL